MYFRSVSTALQAAFGVIALLAASPAAAQQVVQEFDSPGTHSFTVPAGVTQITVEVWGAGGRGGDTAGNGRRNAGGGGGGAYARSTLVVTPGTTLTLRVGQGGNSSAPGEASWFGDTSTVLAEGGRSVALNSNDGAAGGLAANSIGNEAVFNGGDGAGTSGNEGGGGGSSAGTGADGNDAAGRLGATAPAGGGDGGDGAESTFLFGVDGETGQQPGGGGGGATNFFGSASGGSGGDGLIIVRYWPAPPEPVVDYRMEQTGWDGSGGEVEDSSGNGNHGTGGGGADTEIDDPAVPGNPGTCRYATFEASGDFRSGGFIHSPGLSQTLNDSATMTFWIRTTQSSNNSEAWQSPGIAGIEENGGTDDIFWGWIDPSGRIGISVGNDFSADQKSTSPINDGNWRHVALTWNRVSGDTEIYINGVLDQTGNTGSGNVIGNSYSGIGRIENTSAGIDPYYFDGDLDEFRVYSGVLDAGQIAAIRDQTWPCETGYDHIRLIHPESGLTCSPSTITVQACADADCTSLYADPVEVDFTSPAGNWSPDPVAFTGSTQVSLQYTTPGLVVLNAAAIDPPAANATRCFTGGNVETDCEMTWFDSGFVIDIPDHVADTIVNGTIAAARSDPNNPDQCVPGFDDQTRDVDFQSQYLNPATGTEQVRIDGNPVATGSPGTTIPIDFDANGVGAFQLRYPDAGMVAVHAEYVGSGNEAGLVMIGQDQFVARPARFVLDIPGNPAASDHSGDVFTTAGSDFEIRVIAQNAANGITPNFGQESTPEGVDLELSLIAPPGGLEPGLAGSFGTFGSDCEGNSAPAGTACGEFSWPEVGIVSLNPRLASGAYLGSADVVGSPVGHLGRFIPDHFHLGDGNIIDRAGIGGCSSNFTYIGERFDTTFTLYARNAGGHVTANYEGDFAYLGDEDLNLYGAPAPDISGQAVDWVMGAGDAIAQLRLPRTSPEGPYPDYEVGTAPIDSDGVALAGSGLIAATELRFGRIVIDNAIGSELGPLELPWRTEFWDGSTWLTNGDDDCTLLDLAADVQLESSGGDSGDGTASVSLGGGTTAIDEGESGLTLTSGVGAIHFTAPGSPGWVDVWLGLDGNWPFLRDDLDDDDSYEDNPQARASFGLFDGNSQRIHVREVTPQ